MRLRLKKSYILENADKVTYWGGTKKGVKYVNRVKEELQFFDEEKQEWKNVEVYEITSSHPDYYDFS
jgi:hypothetical protein